MQNENESFHQLVWKIVPKNNFMFTIDFKNCHVFKCRNSMMDV